MISLGWFKALSAVIIWFLGFFGGIGPLFCTKVSSRVLGILNIFAGGIFLACSILHLLADAVDNKALAFFIGDKENKLWAYLFYGLGFIMILFIDMLAHDLEGCCSSSSSANEQNHPQSVCANEQLPLLINNTIKSSSSIVDEYPGSTVSVQQIHNIFEGTTAITLIVFISLSFHSIMEGVAIGVQTKLPWDVFLAVIAHKALAAFALGLEIMSDKLSRIKFISFIAIFSLMSPLGIWIGSLAVRGSSNQGTDSLASGICTALSGGTFLFVAVMEIIPQELNNNRQDQLMKCVALSLGFISFGLLAFWT